MPSKNDEPIDPILEEKIINEEFKIWKKNSTYLYDMILIHALEWPSLTVQWIPGGGKRSAAGLFYEHGLLLGTHTSDEEDKVEGNYLKVGSLRLPTEESISVMESNIDEDDFLRRTGRFDVNQTYEHNGEINRARCMPQNPNLVATKGPTAELNLYDISGGNDKPVMKLTGHEKEGYGLAWNPTRKGVLLSGSDDGVVCVWDINETSLSGTQAARMKYTEHTDVVEDVAWHCTNGDVFGSVSDDKMLMLWDDRKKEGVPVMSARVHDAEVTTLSFNPFNDFIVATGSADKTVALWDLRNLKSSMHTLKHTEEVVQVAWSPHHETILASSGSDRRLMVWDVSRIGKEQSAKDAAEGPPELLFVHSGHTAKISDFDWSVDEERTICTVSEDNVLQCWTMGEHVYSEYGYEKEDVAMAVDN
eukprot:CFRG1107T1